MASKRRFGPETSQSRAALLDATEAVMRENGYAALTARSVAERAGLKHQLVYYYFPGMDELVLAAYRRRTEKLLARLEQALASEQPLRAFWQASCNPLDATLTLEYMAMSNHNELIHSATTVFGEHVRKMVAERLTGPLSHGTPDPKVFSPLAVGMAISAIAHILEFEAALGISSGHSDTRALIEWCIGKLEPDKPPAKGIGKDAGKHAVNKVNARKKPAGSGAATRGVRHI